MKSRTETVAVATREILPWQGWCLDLLKLSRHAGAQTGKHGHKERMYTHYMDKQVPQHVGTIRRANGYGGKLRTSSKYSRSYPLLGLGPAHTNKLGDGHTDIQCAGAKLAGICRVIKSGR